MMVPMGLAEMVPRETKGHSRNSSGKGNSGKEAWGRGSTVTSGPDRELDPGHWHGEEKDYEAAGGEGVGEDQEGRKKVTQSLWTWIRGKISKAFVM